MPIFSPNALKPQPALVQLFDLTLVQLSNWRWSWRSYITTGTLAPLLSTLALGLFSRGAGPHTLGYILSGNLILALMFGTLSKVANNFSFMRVRGMLTYFATLPIHSATLVLATVLAFFVLSLPSVLATVLVGALILELPLRLHPALLFILPLSSAAMAGLGGYIGAAARNPEEATSWSLLLTYLLLGLGPVLVPPERLHPILLYVGWLSPAQYAASALRQTLLGPVSSRIWLDIGVLLFWTAGIFWLVERKLNWRQSDS